MRPAPLAVVAAGPKLQRTSMSSSPHSNEVTEGIRVLAAAQYLPRDSDADAKRYVYGYRITLSNEGDRPAELVSRHWVIVDSEGSREDVKGSGVVGEHPRLLPGESYSYVSKCPLPTQWGTMEGSYMFRRDDGERFRVQIGRFFLVPSAPPLQLTQPAR